MEAKQISQLRAFEKLIKEKILSDYGTFITEDRKNQLISSTLISDEFDKVFTSPQNLQGEMFRLVLDKVFEHIICTKNMEFSDGTSPNIRYGDYLKDGLIAYFSKELSEKHGIKIDSIEKLQENMEMFLKVKEVLQGNFYPLVFSCDANAILSAVNLPDLTKLCDKDAVKKYIESLNKKDDKEITESLSGKGKIYPPIYANGVQYIKYIDEDNHVHMIKSSNPKLVSASYKEMIEKEKKGETIDSEDFYETLKKHGEAIPLFKESEIKSSKLSHSESNMLDTIYSDRDLMFKAGDETTQHSSDMDVHIVGTNVVVTDENDNRKVKTDVYEENNTTDPSLEADETKEPRLISEEEYVEICNKSVNGKSVSEDEMRLLEYYDRYYFGDFAPLNEEQKQQELGPTMKLEQSSKPKHTSGFAQKFLPVFIVLITIVVGIILGVAIFKLKGMF